jgi:outer membrane autotransporter protein
MGTFKAAGDRGTISSRRAHWLKLGTCLSGTAAILLAGGSVAHASPYRLDALILAPMASPIAAGRSAKGSPVWDPTIRAAATDVVVKDGDVSTTGDDMPAISTHSAGTTTISAGAITTSGARSSGVVANGTGAIAIDVGSVQTAGDFGYGVRAVAGDMPVFDPATGTVTVSPPADLTVTAGTIATAGFGADGVYAGNLTTGTTNVSVGNVSTHGAQAWGVNANGGGDVNVDVGTATTYGFNGVGVGAGSHGGNVTVTADGVYTSGDSSVGILAQATSGYDADHEPVNGNVTVTAGSVSTASDYSTGVRTVAQGDTAIKADYVTTHGAHADGISATGNGAISITTSRALTTGDYSNGISATADGDISIHAGAVTTQGANSFGVYAHSFYGGASVDVGSVSTSGANGIGVAAIAAGDVHVGADSIKSSGAGVYAISIGGDIDVSTGTIATRGDGATGIVAVNYSEVGKTSVTSGSISTSRDKSYGILAEGFGDVSVQSGSITTSGYGSLGVLGYSVNGAVSVTADKVKTAGEYASGITITNLGTNQASTVKAGDIDVAGDHSSGVQVIAIAGGANIDVGTVTTGGLFGTGINVNTNYYGVEPASGKVQTSITADTIKTSGNGAVGVAVQSIGDVSVDVGSITTSGDIGAQGHTVIFSEGVSTNVLDGGTSIKVGSIDTAGRGAVGMQTYAFNGSTTIDAGNISTAGIFAPGILSRSRYGDIDISADTVTTSGQGSSGIVARAYGSIYQPGSNVAIHAGSVATSGDGATGIVAFSPYGDVNIDSGSIVTTGADTAGITAASLYGHTTIKVGDVSTTGDAIYAIGDGVSITGTGTIAATGNYARGITALSYDDIAINAGTVSSTGDHADAIFAYTQKGNISVNADNVSAGGFLSDGIGAFTYGGDIKVDVGTVTANVGDGIEVRAGYGSHGNATVNAGTIVTNGAGITALAGDNVTITAGSITTHSGTEDAGTQLGQAIKAVAHGDIGITAGDLTTTGYWAEGVYAVANASQDGRQPGNINIDVGSVTTSGYKSTGIYAVDSGYKDGGNQIVTVKAGTIATAGDQASGIYAVGANVDITTTGAVSTTGDLATGIYGAAVGGKTVIAAGGAVSTAGDNSTGIRGFSSAGGVDITSSGPVSTKGANSYGVLAFGAGDLTITNSGAVSTEGAFAHGLYATGNGGDIAVSNSGDIATKGFGANGIRAIQRAGDVTVASTGKISTSGDYASGIITGRDRGGRGNKVADADYDNVSLTADTIATSGAHSNGAVAVNYQFGGTTSVKVGNVVTTGAGSAGIATATFGDVSIEAGNVQSRGTGIYAHTISGDTAVTVTGSVKSSADSGIVISSFEGDNVVNVASGASVTGGGQHDLSMSNAGDGVLLALYHGGATVNNAGLITTSGNGYAIEAASTPDYYTGGYDNKVVVNNSGRIIGAVRLSGDDDTLNNTGVFVATKDSDFGAGQDRFVNSGTLIAATGTKPGTVSFLGLESFENSGLVDLRNGVAGDTLKLSGAYVGSGNARLGLDLGANGAADNLVIAGAATGHTGIVLNTSAATATLLAKPVTLVTAGAGSSADAFSILDGDVGFVRYGLGFSAATNSFQLKAGAGSSVSRIGKATEAAQSIWRKSPDAWSSHMAELRDGARPDERVWGQAYGAVENRHGHEGGDDVGYRQDYYGFQAGVDLAGKRSEDGNGVVFGLTGGYLSSKVNFRAGAERLHFDTVDVGGYAAFRAGPLFANLLGQYDHYRIDASNGAEHWNDRFNGSGYGAQGEVGARLGHDSLFAEPVASLAWTKTDLGTLHALGQSIDFGNGSALTGKLGLRVGGTSDMGGGNKAVFYARASYVHTLHGRGSALLESGGTSARIAGAKLGDHGEGAVGVNLLTTGPLSGFIEGDADAGGGLKGGGGRIGIRFKL